MVNTLPRINTKVFGKRFPNINSTLIYIQLALEMFKEEEDTYHSKVALEEAMRMGKKAVGPRVLTHSKISFLNLNWNNGKKGRLV